MILRRYRAATLARALEKARAELGPQALVVAQEKRPGGWGLELVEVTVAAPRPAPPAAAPEARWLAEIRAARARLGLARPGSEALPPPAPQAPAPPPRWAKVAAVLQATGLSADLAGRFVTLAEREMAAATRASGLDSLARAAAQIWDFAPEAVSARCLFLVGPAGSGKTMTAAKLAAAQRWLGGRAVFFAQADCESLGAFEQAALYAEHLDLVPARVEGPEDLQRVLEDAGCSGCVVVDTPPLGPRHPERRAHLARLRDAAPDAALAVLVPATMREPDAVGLLESLASLGPTCGALTRVDETPRWAEPLAVFARRRLPVAFVTDGDRVPQDLRLVEPHVLAAMLLRGGATRVTTEDRGA